MPFCITHYSKFISVFIAFTFCYGAEAGGIAMRGTPKLPDKFDSFSYISPNAKREGKVTYGVVGTFDGLNPFVIRSFRTTARALFIDADFSGLVYEAMMVRSRDEPFTLYNLLAEKVELNDKRTEITFFLNPKAHFSDGNPVTVEDVLFTIKLLKDKGRPPFNQYMKHIEATEKIGSHGVKISFPQLKDREFPIILASTMPVLPKHAVNIDDFEKNGLTKIPGSGPYVIEHIDPGERIIYKRDPNYWGKDLPVNKGLHNFSTIQIEYFLHDAARFEAFKKGDIDVFIETDPNRWRLSYNFPAVYEGKVIKESFPKRTPADITGFVFNTRRDIFKDKKVRQALSMLFDFEWVNRHLFNSIYIRTEGYWDGSIFSAVGKQASTKERALLAPFPDAVLPEVMDGSWHMPKINGPDIARLNAQKAWDLLQQAGFTRKNNRAIAPNGLPFQFEIMTQTLDEEKVALAFQSSLARLGIHIQIRTVDDAQYQNRLGMFDYDMIIGKFRNSLSPGNEQINRWSSASRNLKGSYNFAGAADPAIDAMITAMLSANSNDDFIAAVRALDRILISGSYYIPLYHLPDQWVAYWSYIKHPAYTPLYGYYLPAWWRE
ncbi:ABC transporter, periplasmic oligopeptide-binding protein [Bartonella australis AUST/NH1]|uniref:ABC transporter, periplasmic oligopeptide-binding protein n=1 Tax=Bartonella australis (strain Aust/NH1) TaxID=1094489 RepID=M1PD87_BARAA|nr:extracellular solute-binding protein [Bartonella australis]AGF74551.1 ABC transporter, periplasmic oligopeptide-binding protein [Bartonella australis AUST/NH1]